MFLSQREWRRGERWKQQGRGGSLVGNNAGKVGGDPTQYPGGPGVAGESRGGRQAAPGFPHRTEGQ